MTKWRVTVLVRHTDGTDWASIHGPFDNLASAARFANEARIEDPEAAVDVIPYETTTVAGVTAA